MKKRIRIQGTLIFLSAIFSVLLSRSLFPPWKTEFLDEAFDLLGIILVLCGFLFRISSRGYKGEKSRQGWSLVKEGPYLITRNPMYLGTFLIGSGFISILFNWWVFPLFLIIFLAIYIPQTRAEEKKLSLQFGQEYRDYQKKTHRFISFSKLFTLDVRQYLPFKWPWVKKEYTSLLLALVAIVGLESWQDTRLFGRHEYTGELLGLLVSITVIVLFAFYLSGENK